MFQPQSINTSNATANRTQQYSELLLEKAQGHFELRRCLEGLDSGGRVATEDQGPVLHEQFVSIRHNNFAYEKVKAIDAALDRMNHGEYGICKECGEPISEKRLKAVPWTQYCLHCQEALAGDNDSLAFTNLRAA